MAIHAIQKPFGLAASEGVNSSGHARGAIDAWMGDLTKEVPRLRGSVVICEVAESPEEFRAAAPFQVVGSTGIEPVTPTMSR